LSGFSEKIIFIIITSAITSFLNFSVTDPQGQQIEAKNLVSGGAHHLPRDLYHRCLREHWFRYRVPLHQVDHPFIHMVHLQPAHRVGEFIYLE